MTPTSAAGRAAALSAALLVVGLLLGRPDLVGMAAPFVIGLVVVGVRAHAPQPTVAVAVSAGTAREGEAVDLSVTMEAVRDLDAVVVTVEAAGFSVVEGAARTVTAVEAGSATVVRLRLVPTRWGRRYLGPVTVAAAGPLYLTRSVSPVTVAPVRMKVLPAVQPFHASDLTPRAIAYSGVHRSRNTGPGAEFATVRPFQPADQPRRINWRASLRSSALQVNAAYTDRASRVLVVIDSQSAGGRPGRSSIDLSVRAAAGIAEHYLSIGDTVGLVEYGGRNRILPPGVGTRHLALIHDWLVDVGPLSAATPPARRWLAGLRSSGSLIIVLTPLLDEAAAARLVTLRSRGAALIAVDCLPPGALPSPVDQAAALAARLWQMERDRLRSRLAELGIPVVSWTGAGSLDRVLADLARLAAAPKAAVR
ncbi:MAG TPA: DUF58 domain-containing protein [Acidimicrobiales bacterium]|nr:DUF58 domain-containing protein [Acidimicrobiales bacterium]